ncbi:MAG: HisA/HisF-related TIM barrel protein [Pseudomonadota bacterium]
MKVIPVLDFLQGNIVLAQHGQRDSYLPVNSKLCPCSEPMEVIKRILSITDFDTIYIADLDSIEKNQFKPEIWQAIFNKLPQIEFWIDIGGQVTNWNKFFINYNNAKPIIGSESFTSVDQLENTLSSLSDLQATLSLDYKNNELLGPPNLLDELRVWPKNIIFLNLNQVGSFQGLDVKMYNQVSQSLPNDCNLYIGGGIKNKDDLIKAREQQISGVLIASALHNQTISREELDEFTR